MNTYDHRIKELVIASGDHTLFENQGVNPSTARNWIYGRYNKPIEVEHRQAGKVIRDRQIEKLHREIKKLQALVELYRSMNKVANLDLRSRNIRCRTQRKEIISRVETAARVVGVKPALDFIGISQSRYKRWRSSSPQCQLSKTSSCIRRYPNQLSNHELSTIRDLVISKKFAHMSKSSLHLYAKREGLLNCSQDTWYKYIDKHGWQRPYQKEVAKKYPDRIRRADEPNEILHIDVTQVKTRSGKTYYLQTILDNYSRYILAWRLHTGPLGANTAGLLSEAFRNVEEHSTATPNRPRLVSDRGSENINAEVDTVVRNSEFEHRLHNVDIRYSNNMVEVFFRSLKNNYLNYLPARSKPELLRRLRFYISEHNNHVPLAALGGATPQEKYSGTWVPPCAVKTQKEKDEAKKKRLLDNRLEICGNCWEN